MCTFFWENGEVELHEFQPVCLNYCAEIHDVPTPHSPGGSPGGALHDILSRPVVLASLQQNSHIPPAEPFLCCVPEKFARRSSSRLPHVIYTTTFQIVFYRPHAIQTGLILRLVLLLCREIHKTQRI